MKEREKATQLVCERGYDSALRMALILRRHATYATTRVYWGRVIEELKFYEMNADLPEGG